MLRCGLVLWAISPSYFRTGFRIKLWVSPPTDLATNAELELMVSGKGWPPGGGVKC